MLFTQRDCFGVSFGDAGCKNISVLLNIAENGIVLFLKLFQATSVNLCAEGREQLPMINVQCLLMTAWQDVNTDGIHAQTVVNHGHSWNQKAWSRYRRTDLTVRSVPSSLQLVVLQWDTNQCVMSHPCMILSMVWWAWTKTLQPTFEIWTQTVKFENHCITDL